MGQCPVGHVGASTSLVNLQAFFLQVWGFFLQPGVSLLLLSSLTYLMSSLESFLPIFNLQLCSYSLQTFLPILGPLLSSLDVSSTRNYGLILPIRIFLFSGLGFFPVHAVGSFVQLWPSSPLANLWVFFLLIFFYPSSFVLHTGFTLLANLRLLLSSYNLLFFHSGTQLPASGTQTINQTGACSVQPGASFIFLGSDLSCLGLFFPAQGSFCPAVTPILIARIKLLLASLRLLLTRLWYFFIHPCISSVHSAGAFLKPRSPSVQPSLLMSILGPLVLSMRPLLYILGLSLAWALLYSFTVMTAGIFYDNGIYN